LAPLLRGIIDYLAGEFNLDEKMRALLCYVSPATIDRKLIKHKERYRLKGIHTTKPGSLLKSQIPVRVCFDWDEKKPGYFELDTVSHCGAQAQGRFCQTLTITDVGSGWTEECALLNNAHRWVKEQIAYTHQALPFPTLGIDSDNGGEFINHQVLDWCIQNNIKFTRGRPYRKNDNCFVEQKNGDVVRKTVGYARFEGQNAFNALSDV
jgi:IS30 family transposase